MSESPEELVSPVTARGRGWWTAFAISTVIFTFGVIFGAVVMSILTRDDGGARFDSYPFRPDRMAGRLSNDLDLSPEQAERVHEIFRSQHEQLSSIRAETEPRVREVLDETHALVMSELTEEQRARWDEKFENMRRRMRAPGWDRPRGGGRDGGPRSAEMRLPRHAERFVDRYDMNADGKLDFDEASLAWERMTPERFKRMDLDGDGLLDAPEISAARERFEAERVDTGVPEMAPNE